MPDERTTFWSPHGTSLREIPDWVPPESAPSVFEWAKARAMDAFRFSGAGQEEGLYIEGCKHPGGDLFFRVFLHSGVQATQFVVRGGDAADFMIGPFPKMLEAVHGRQS